MDVERLALALSKFESANTAEQIQYRTMMALGRDAQAMRMQSALWAQTNITKLEAFQAVQRVLGT